MDKQERIDRAVIELDGEWPGRFIKTGENDAGDTGWAVGSGDLWHAGEKICTYPEFMEARKRLENKPSWDDAPEWANSLGQDSDGSWVFLPHYNPNDLDHEEWLMASLSFIDMRYEKMGKGHVFGDWRQSLEPRPHPDHKEGEGVEWEPGVVAPPIGTKVKYPSGEGVVKLPPDRNGVVVVSERGEYKKVAASACERTKSHRDKVIEAAEKIFLRFASSKQIGDYKRRQILGGLYDDGALKLPGDDQ